MNKKEKLKLLQYWETQYNVCNTAWSGINLFMNMDVESPLSVAIWKTFDHYTKTLEQLLGDNDGRLFWYCYDNEMGKKGLPAGKTKKKPVRTLENLVRLI